MEDLNHELKLAIDFKDFNKIFNLLERGANPNIKSYKLKYTAFEVVSIYKCNIKNISFLITKGANIHGIPGGFGSGLHFACMNLNKIMIEYFLELGVDVNSSIVDKKPITYIYYHNTVRCIDVINTIPLLEYLIDKGAYIYDKNGELFEELKDRLQQSYDIEDYYNNKSTYSNLKPVKI
jgi:ankyrin repeat protein